MKSRVSAMMKSKILFIVFFGFLLAGSYAQTKDEREEGIRKSEFPNAALALLDSLTVAPNRIKYFRETDGNKSSFEAKFKWRKQRYSVEFDPSGNLEDIEIEVSFSKINPDAKSEIRAYFERVYKKVKIVKIQEQYVPEKGHTNSELINELFKKPRPHPSGFEVIAELRTNSGKLQFKEFLFDENGMYLNERSLKLSSYEFISY